MRLLKSLIAKHVAILIVSRFVFTNSGVDMNKEENMKKWLVWLGALFLVSCVSTQSVIDGFTPLWVNRNFDEFVLEYGAPYSEFKLQSGSTLYKWSSGITSVNMPVTTHGTVYNSGYGTSNFTSYTSGGAINMVCEMDILVNEQNNIQSIKITKDSIGVWVTSRCSEVLDY